MRVKLDAELVKLDRQGYDRRGRYWGRGERLYRVTCDETDPRIDEHVRAANAKAAKQAVFDRAFKLLQQAPSLQPTTPPPRQQRKGGVGKHGFPKRTSGPEGYCGCACRDCFDVAIGKPGQALCNECQAAGCEAQNGECQRADAYGT